MTKFIKPANYDQKVDEIISNMIEKERKSEEQKQEIFSSDNYLIWLEQFTTTNNEFSDNSYIYLPSNISQEDNENVNKLCLLYEGIEEYAKEKGIIANANKYLTGIFYNLIYNDICYEIGIVERPYVVYFCKRKTFNKDITYIDFKDIISKNKKVKKKINKKTC